MKIADRLYLVEEDLTGWDMVPSMPRDTTLRRKTLVALAALGCPRNHACAALGVSQATFTRDKQVLEKAEPGFGTDKWRLAYLEREAEQLRRKIDRDAALEAMGN